MVKENNNSEYICKHYLKFAHINDIRNLTIYF